jgi:hypothetical protein
MIPTNNDIRRRRVHRDALAHLLNQGDQLRVRTSLMLDDLKHLVNERKGNHRLVHRIFSVRH